MGKYETPDYDVIKKKEIVKLESIQAFLLLNTKAKTRMLGDSKHYLATSLVTTKKTKKSQ